MRQRCPAAQVQQGGGVFQVLRDGAGPGDDVEQQVPLRAHQHQQHRRQVQPARQRAAANSRKTGKSAVAGTEAAICTSGWSKAARRGLVPISTPTGIVQSRAMSQRDHHAQPGCQQAQADAAPIPAAVHQHQNCPTRSTPKQQQYHRPADQQDLPGAARQAAFARLDPPRCSPGCADAASSDRVVPPADGSARSLIHAEQRRRWCSTS